MSKTIMRISDGGEIRAIVGSGLKPGTLEVVGCCSAAKRASHVEPIQSGPYKNYWMVDMSPMGEGWQYCLWPPLPTRAEALKVEHQHLEQKWIRS